MFVSTERKQWTEQTKLQANDVFGIKFRLLCGRIYKRFIWGGFERKHFWMCFDCVINEFPFWWHFPDLSCSVRALLSLSLSLPLSLSAHLHLLFSFAAANRIWIVCFCNSGLFNANIYSSSMFWMISKRKISQNPVNHQMMLFINKLGMSYIVVEQWNWNVCTYSWLWMQGAMETLENK